MRLAASDWPADNRAVAQDIIKCWPASGPDLPERCLRLCEKKRSCLGYNRKVFGMVTLHSRLDGRHRLEVNDHANLQRRVVSWFEDRKLMKTNAYTVAYVRHAESQLLPTELVSDGVEHLPG